MGHILSKLFPFLGSVFNHWQIWLSGGGLGGVIVLGTALYEKIFKKPLSIRAYVYIFVIAFFLCACFLSWVDRDDALISEKRSHSDDREEAQKKYAALSTDYGKLDARCQYQSGVVDTLGKQNRDQQNTINGCQAHALQLLEQSQTPIVRTFMVTHDNKPGVPKMEYVLTTTTTRTPVDLRIHCDFPITSAVLSPMTERLGPAFVGGEDGPISATEYRVGMSSPSWSPAFPLFVTVFLEPPVTHMPNCKINVR